MQIKRPWFYPVTLELPEEEDQAVERSIPTTGYGMEVKWITWDQTRIISEDPQDPNYGIPNRDGLFSIEVRSGTDFVQQNPVLVRNMLGEPNNGHPVALPIPFITRRKDPLTVRLTNRLDRTGMSAGQRTVEICFCGVELIGDEE